MRQGLMRGGAGRIAIGCKTAQSLCCVFCLLLLPKPALAEQVPSSLRQHLQQFCSDCHSGDAPEGSTNLDSTEINWQLESKTWDRAYEAITSGDMPPADAAQPTKQERNNLAALLKTELTNHAPLIRTPPRRLNRLEYQNTIRRVFELNDFNIPESFPADDSKHGFDNVADGLIFSPPLMAEYLKIATRIADEVIPPQRTNQKPDPRKFEIGVPGLADGEGGAEVEHKTESRYRLISSRHMASVAAWPSRFEAPVSGEYKFTVKVATYQTDKMKCSRSEKPFGVSVYARPKTDQVYAPFADLRRLAKFELPSNNKPAQFSAKVTLMKGEVFGIRWDDGPAFSDAPIREYSPKFLSDRLKRDRRYYAAMLSYKGGPRGINQSDYYDAVVAEMNRKDLDLQDARLDKMPEKWGGGLGNGPHNWIARFVHEEFRRFGPAVDVLDVGIEGPFALVEDAESLARKKRKAGFMGQRVQNESDGEYVRAILRRFFPRVFRRQVDPETLESFATSAMNRLRKPDTTLEDVLHIAIRRALVSPRFLYRNESQSETLDQFSLANRLSYFLTSSPPDEQLFSLAGQGGLSGDVLKDEVKRLIADDASDHFVRSFTGQWLKSRQLESIMADPRLLPFFTGDRRALERETEMFFAEMLRENHPVSDFIDPGFSFRNAQHNKVYGGDLKGNEMRRVTFARGGKEGGLPGLASIMMATANGVDTHPVHRGVWLLENVLGDPVPPPPDNVPAISPDTAGTTTIRAQLDAHRADEACARCHDKIDPVGMIMENFDPVGRWRENYPVYTKPKAEELKKEFYANIGNGTKAGPPIETEVELSDGTKLTNVVDLKRHILANLDDFSACLTEKLLVYATGRELGFHDKQEVKDIVQRIKENGNGFQDLVIEVAISEAFAR